MKILVSGFQPFGDHAINPTASLVECIQNKIINLPKHIELASLVLPVAFDSSFVELKERIELFDPEIILCFGLSAKAEFIELERVAINCMDAHIPDNKGHQPRDNQIDQAGPAAYFSTLPIRDLEAALLKVGIPARVSNSAGTFVCNYLFYQLMKMNLKTNRKCGFIHVPSENTLDMDVLIKGFEIILRNLAH